MRQSPMMIALAAALMAACQPQTPPAAKSDSTASEQRVEPPRPLPTTPPTLPPETGEPGGPAEDPLPGDADGSRALAHWDGYSASKFGMSEPEVRKAWNGELKADKPLQGSTCHHLFPAVTMRPTDLALMFNDGKFKRYSVESATYTAPGGGQVGMDTAEIEKRYAGRIETQPHKYSDGGKYLRIRNGDNVLVFETDAMGKVREWRVGQPPEVDYVEGCS